MGRASRKSTGGGGTSTGERTASLPMPSRDSVLLDIEDGCIGYYEQGRLMYIDANLELYTSGDEGQDFVDEEYGDIMKELLDRARQQLQETGEIGFVSGREREIDFDVRTGYNLDRTEERWREGGMTIEPSLHVDANSDISEETNPAIVERELRGSSRSEAAKALQEVEEQNSKRYLRPVLSEEQIAALGDNRYEMLLLAHENNFPMIVERARERAGDKSWDQRSAESQIKEILEYSDHLDRVLEHELESARADMSMAAHIEAMDEQIEVPEPSAEELERMKEREHLERAKDRAQDDAAEEGIDWDSLDANGQSQKIAEASETILEENLNRAERQADDWG